MRERWECVRNFGVQTGKEPMECWDTHVGKHPWSIGMFQGQGKKCWAGPQIWVSPPNPRCLWSRPGELCQGDKGAKVTPPGLLPALGDATSALLELHLEQLFPPGALESQPRREKLLGWDGVGGTDVALLGSGWWILELMMLVHTQGKLPSVSRAVGIILKDFSSQFAAVGP